MSWDYRIIAPAEATALLDNPGEYVPQTPLGPFRPIFEWLTSRAAEWHPRGVDGLSIRIGEDGYVLIELFTVRRHRTLVDAFRQQERGADKSYDCIQNRMAAYVPADDEGVTEIHIEGRGTGDITLIAQCAAWLNATVFDCQTSELLTPD